jgi:hypothetical protein
MKRTAILILFLLLALPCYAQDEVCRDDVGQLAMMMPIVGGGGAAGPCACTSLKTDYQEAQDDSDSILSTAAHQGIAIGFTASGGALCKVGIYMETAAALLSPARNLTAYIYTYSDVTHLPTTLVATTSSSALSTDNIPLNVWAWYYFDFTSNPTLTASTVYFIALVGDGYGDSTHRVALGIANSTHGGTGQYIAAWGGSAWSVIETAYQGNFRVFYCP